MIGGKYVSKLLKVKYDTNIEEVYLREKRKAIMSTEVYIGKMVNGINLHSENERNRGNLKAKCPICDQREDWLHIISCCGTNINK